MTTPTLAPMLAVSEYARRVREHLADLTADEVAELTEGMEADLVEALLESPAADDALPSLERHGSVPRPPTLPSCGPPPAFPPDSPAADESLTRELAGSSTRRGTFSIARSGCTVSRSPGSSHNRGGPGSRSSR